MEPGGPRTLSNKEVPVSPLTRGSQAKRPSLDNGKDTRPRREISSQSPTPSDRSPPKHRYPLRHRGQPRPSLRESHPGLFSDSEDETSEGDAIMIEEDIITIEDSPAPSLPPIPHANTSQTDQRNRPKPLPLPPKPPSRKIGASNHTPSATIAQRLFKLPLPGARQLPLPSSSQIKIKQEPEVICLDVESSAASTGSSTKAPEPTQIESFREIIEQYLKSQQEGWDSARTVQDAPNEGGKNTVDSAKKSSSSGQGGGSTDAMDVSDGGSSSTAAPVPSLQFSLTTPSGIHEPISKRKRPPEAQDEPPQPQPQPPAQPNPSNSPTLPELHGAPSQAPDSEEETQASQQMPPTPISPGSKRRKYSYTQHPSHWAPDGNVLVQIEQTRFKLHRSRLAKQSGYFQRAFEKTSNDSVLYLSDTGVTAAEFEVLLDSLEDFMDYFYTTPPFTTVASILRASTLLSFDKYATWAQRYLVNMWPTSLSQLSTTRTPYALESLALSREFGVTPIRKRVLYELVRTPRFGQPHPANTSPSSEQLRLSPADLTILNSVREELMMLWVDATAAPSRSRSGSVLTQGLSVCIGGDRVATCTTREEALADSAHLGLVVRSGIFRDFMWDPLCGLQALMELDWSSAGFCVGCVDIRKTVWRTIRENIWEKLDVLFMLTRTTGNV